MVTLVTGGTGLLGKELQKRIKGIYLSSKDIDITNRKSVKKILKKIKPDLILHLAAMTDVTLCEKEKKKTYDINVNGTRKIFELANCKIVYISTDYVFDGEKGNYKEDDPVNPVNYYSLTKLLGEEIIKTNKKNLIIRTSFVKDEKWPYEKAFIDKFTSGDLVPIIADEITKAISFYISGIIHIGTKRKSIYELAKKKNPDIKPNSIKDIPFKIPRDTSLNIDKWRKIKDDFEKKRR